MEHFGEAVFHEGYKIFAPFFDVETYAVEVADEGLDQILDLSSLVNNLDLFSNGLPDFPSVGATTTLEATKLILDAERQMLFLHGIAVAEESRVLHEMMWNGTGANIAATLSRLYPAGSFSLEAFGELMQKFDTERAALDAQRKVIDAAFAKADFNDGLISPSEANYINAEVAKYNESIVELRRLTTAMQTLMTSRVA